MTVPTQHLIRHLFRVETLEEVSRQQLEELVEEYPSFGVGRYLLSSKLQAEAAEHFREETQKTNLYFSNPFWLQWLLQEQAPSVALPEEPVARIPAEEVFAPVTDPTEATIETHTRQEEEPDEAGWTPLPPEEPEVPAVHETPEVQEEAVQEAPAAQEEPSSEPSAADLLLQRIAEIKDQRQAERQESEVPVVQEETAPPMGIAGLALEQLEEEHAPTTPVVTEPEIEAPLEMPAPEEEAVEETPVPEAITPEEISAPETSTAEPEMPVTEPEIPADEETPALEIPAVEARQEPEPVVQQTAPPVEEPATSSPVFEAFHTVDYFASQGIRLVLDENPSDKLGKQLKSFTEWLKVMRRLPQKNREIVPDIAAERQIQAIAATSIEGKEVVTEAMAEVLAKQGMREKATEMYRKLSLLEPEKSAYFATRIEQLKII